MIRWNLTGTESQIAVAREAFDHIFFPFERLSAFPTTIPELGWLDLNAEAALAHGDHHHGDEDNADKYEGPDPSEPSRKIVYGIIYLRTGRIYIDKSLEAYPLKVRKTIGAELGHAVDLFLPMTDKQRNELLRLWNKGGTWWEVESYANEYYRLGGEAFMHEFVKAYTNIDFGSTSSFMHDAGVEPLDVRRILGIQRTDDPSALQPWIYPSATGETVTIPTPPPAPASRARLILTQSGQDIEIGGNVLISGTALGGEEMKILSGNIQLDASFNKGGDTVILPGPAGSYSATLRGSNVIITNGGRTVSIPVGVVGISVKFGDTTKTLKVNTTTGKANLGTQVVTTTPTLVQI